MKTWQMIKELTENPKKVFMRDYDELVVKVDKTTETLSWESGHEHLCIDDEWVEVKQPVTWQEAIQAWVDGKEVMCIVNGSALEYAPSNFGMEDQYEAGISYREIKEGEWYINE